MKKSILYFVIFALASLSVFGFIGWSLSTHGAMGLLRVTPLFLYAVILVAAFGFGFLALVFLYWRLRKKGKGNRILVSNIVISAVIIVSFSVIFIQLGGLPPSKDIERLPQLPISDTNAQNFHFAVGSDSHFGSGTNSPEYTIAMLEHISNPANDYDNFFFLGDVVEYGFNDSHWEQAINVFTPAASLIPTRFVPGNHDTLFGGLRRYLDFCSPELAETQSDSRLWYRVDVGNVHFLMLDVEWTGETITKDQTTWLENQLKSIPVDDWKIVLNHGFYYSSGSRYMGWNWYDNPETISALSPLFERYDVDIVFSGHNHFMEYLEHSGVNYIICGTFGGHLDSVPTYISPSSIWLKALQPGFAEVTINGNQATVNFRDPGENILESFTITKQNR